MEVFCKDDQSGDDDEDAMFRALERDADIDYSNIREKRMEELKSEMIKLQALKNNSHGTYENILTEKELMEITTKEKICLIHFYHKEFRRCQIMDKHLEIIARSHFNTRIVKIDVDNAPFLVERLKVQVLPCLVAFMDGISLDRLVGFEELGSNDNFTTRDLEKRLAQCKIIRLGDRTEEQARKTIFGFKEKMEEDDDDWE